MTRTGKFRFWVKRFVRGWAALVTLNLVLITGAVALEACETQEEGYANIDRLEALDSFESIVRTTTPRINKMITETPEVAHDNDGAHMKGYQAFEKEMQNTMRPVIEGATRLLRTYNVDEGFLESTFGNAGDPRIAMVGLMILASENRYSNKVAMDFAKAFGNLGYAQEPATLEESANDWVDCLIVAVGIDVAVDFLKGNVTEAIAKKAIRKIATRTLGFVGAAIAVYEFGSCMGWY